MAYARELHEANRKRAEELKQSRPKGATVKTEKLEPVIKTEDLDAESLPLVSFLSSCLSHTSLNGRYFSRAKSQSKDQMKMRTMMKRRSMNC